MRLRTHSILCAAVAVALSFSARADSSSNTFEQAFADFERARQGDGGATDRAVDQFQKLFEQELGNPLYLAYYGSSLTIRGKNSWAPWNKIKHTERGLDLLDKAVGMLKPSHDDALMRGVPVAVETLLVASATFLGVPASFHHFEAGKAAVATALASPVFSKAPARVRAEVWQQASIVANKEGKRDEETKALRQALELWPNAGFAGAARERLKELGQ